MKTLYLLITIIIGFSLSSCASTPPPVNAVQTPAKKTHKNPLSVSFYSNDVQLKKSYKILGVEKVSKYNTAGIKRQEATIQDTMRKLAAAMGGDAVINVQRNNQHVSGTVVSFEDDHKNKKV